jgi:hypothetical protein
MSVVENWTCDGYRFRQNGSSLLPRKNPVLNKIHYQLFLPQGQKSTFKKFVYQHLADQNFLVVHYVGDDKEAIDLPHGW